MSQYTEYLSALRTNYKPAVKIDFLNPDGTVSVNVSNYYQDVSGTLTVNMQNGTRRTAEITIENSDNTFMITPESIWYGQKVKLWAGLFIDGSTPYYIPQGVFYVSSVTSHNTVAVHTMTISLVDKWAYLDGTLYGHLDGIYLVPIGSNIYGAISSLLNLSRFTGLDVTANGEPKENAIDSTPPLFDSYYLTKTYTDGTTTYNAINTPYEVRMEYGKTIADILLEFATMLGAYIYYNADGRLTIEPTQDDIKDSTKPVLWEFVPNEAEFIGDEKTSNFGEFYNDVIVKGYVTNGAEAHARVQNLNPASWACVQRNGIKTHEIYQNTAYYTDAQCAELATYYLKQLTILQSSHTLVCAPIYHLRENRLVTVVNPYNLTEKDTLLVSGISLPIGTTGEMTINATSVNAFVFENA